MQLLVISGDGMGAGKTTLSKNLADETWSLAGALRQELAWLYPGYDWHNRTQEYKANTRVKEVDDKTVRDVLIEHGQAQCAKDPLHYVRQLADRLTASRGLADGVRRVAVDDLRKVIELDYLQMKFPKLLHFHVENAGAGVEPYFENEQLKERADYIVKW